MDKHTEAESHTIMMYIILFTCIFVTPHTMLAMSINEESSLLPRMRNAHATDFFENYKQFLTMKLRNTPIVERNVSRLDHVFEYYAPHGNVVFTLFLSEKKCDRLKKVIASTSRFRKHEKTEMLVAIEWCKKFIQQQHPYGIRTSKIYKQVNTKQKKYDRPSRATLVNQ